MVYDEKKLLQGSRAKKIEYEIDANGCWICISHTKSSCGYPQLERNKKFFVMSRYIYECEHGKIPDGMEILHACDNPACINPQHLSVGSHQENMHDKIIRGRQSKGENFKSAKLTEEKVKKILQDNRTTRKIAAEYKVSKTVIWMVKTRKIWTHVVI